MRGRLALIGAAAAALLAATPASAAVDYFLQIDGIQGPSTTRPGAIELSSFSWGASNSVGAPTGGGADRESGAPSVSEIVVTKTVDSTSPLLLRALTGGTHFASATLYLRKAGGQSFLEYKLTDVRVSSDRQSSGGDRPTESLTLNFSKIETAYDTGATGRATTAVPAGATATSSPWAAH